jgi:hypothetical protein
MAPLLPSKKGKSMNIKLLLLCSFSLLCSIILGNTLEIKQDGTGDYTTIQAGIEAATHSDTVLVYPGTYYENIDYLEKSITVASLYVIDSQDSLITQTIIDGNQQARCVTISNCESAVIIGLTIQNGLSIQEGVSEAYQGGGIFIKNVMNSLVSNCKIQYNSAIDGGGIYILQSQNILAGNIISNNRSVRFAGGLAFAGSGTSINFSEDKLNSIYLNYSSTGSDIFIGYNIPDIVNIVVDTLTIDQPDYFFIGPSQQCTISQLNSKINQIDQDLYVSPVGDDNNSGLSPEEPLQTLAWAQTLIKRNDHSPNTIHLAEGIYSPSLNNQIFPLNVKHGVIYKGVSQELTILDAEDESSFFYQVFRDQSELSKLVMKDLKMINGSEREYNSNGGIYIYQADLNLENVTIVNCNGSTWGVIKTSNGYCNFNNLTVKNNTGWEALSLGIEHNCPNPVRNIKITNSRFINNRPIPYEPDFPGGGAMKIGGHSVIQGNYYAELINCEITSNHNAYDYAGYGGTHGAYLRHLNQADIINCTFSDNTLVNNNGSTIHVNNSELNFINSIVYGNEGVTFRMNEDSVLNASHSLIEGGAYNIDQFNPNSEINWLEGNLEVFTNPQFLGADAEYPFALSDVSPCLDAGTMDLPAGIELPEYDLAGNPRIYGAGIDMGAYEFQGEPQNAEEDELVVPQTNKISSYPNPFYPLRGGRSSSSNIHLELAESGQIEFAIYNIKGQKVKGLLDAYSSQGRFELQWDGKDDAGKPVASGTYLIKLSVNQELRQAKKITVLK